MQKPLRELGRLCLGATGQANHPVIVTEVCTEPRGGLPLLQVWPSDSPRGEADGQAFVFPDVQDNVNDSGIESIQASPSPTCAANSSSSPATTPQQSRRPSLLHPDHARLHLHHHHHHHHEKSGKGYISPDRTSIDEDQELTGNNNGRQQQQPPSPSSSTTSSLRSMPSSAVTSMHSHERRRSSRYSMFDALDLEYALLRAAARGSVGPYSLSESLHKLTFTQSLAFPALARGLASKQSGVQSGTRRPQQHGESGMNAFAKVVTALVLVLVSVLVFGVVYKFVRT
ncbi:uncharacterized protein LOC100122666 isoform X2 [Nasonia vitripennis]|uniref:Uncharacterized protein n=1 Tax=Nasonia vitripennis TaxID=7425 RepID=A0A7M7H929_NASVI|nr:uncharacterized protein LOC100122666 isoform X2 [Nasonia vitripennis]